MIDTTELTTQTIGGAARLPMPRRPSSVPAVGLSVIPAEPLDRHGEPELDEITDDRAVDRLRQLTSGPSVHAWMLVVPVDALAVLVPAAWSPGSLMPLLVLSLINLCVLSAGGRYRARLNLSFLDELPSVAGKFLASVGIVAIGTAISLGAVEVLPFLIMAWQPLVLLLAGRLATTLAISTARRRGWISHRTLLVGGGSAGVELSRILHENRRYGLDPVGYVDGTERGGWAGGWAIDRLGGFDDTERLVAKHGVDVLLVVDGDLAENTLLELFRKPACYSCDLLVVPRLHQFQTQTGLNDHIGAIPVMRIRQPRLRGPMWAIKRLFDIVVSAVAMLLLSPVLLACALAVRLEGGPGIIFRQERVGRNGRIIEVMKFRSMRPADKSESDTQWNISTDKRVGTVGKLLRRTSLDELPQLVNILRGDMTLVGPRPERPHFVKQFEAEFPRYTHRHRVAAGLTGLAQVSGLRGDTPIGDRARFDNFYIENWSLWLDIKVILRTVGEVLFGRGR